MIRSRTNAKGFQLVEVVLALALAAGPLLTVLHLVHASLGETRRNQDRATAALALEQVAEMLLGETGDRLRELAGAGNEAALDAMLDARVERMPESVRAGYRAQLLPLRGSLSCSLDEDVPGCPGLATLRVRAKLANGATIEVRQLIRPAARG